MRHGSTLWEEVAHQRDRRDLIHHLGVTLDSDNRWVPPADLTPEGESAYLRLTFDEGHSHREEILRRRHQHEVRLLNDRYTKLHVRYWLLLLAFGMLTVPLLIAWNW